MKFYELKALFSDLIKDVKKEHFDKPSIKYIMIAYTNIFKKLDTYSENEAVTDRKLNNLDCTKHMKEKLIELSHTSISKKQAEEIVKNRKLNALKKDLTDLLGIGDKKINELISSGLTNIKQLNQKKWFGMLNTDTQIIITHNPSRSIKYEDAAKVEDKLTGFNKDVIIAGSYRRKKPVIRDFDILFLSHKDHDIETYLEYLKKKFNNKVWIYVNGNDKISMVFQPDSDSIKEIKYKADIFITSPENYYSMLLYTTGSKFHNIKMRSRAKRMGLLLNQNGIFRNGVRINKNSDNEEKLFSILDMSYIEPEKRF